MLKLPECVEIIQKNIWKRSTISISLVYRFFRIDNLGLDSNDFDQGFAFFCWIIHDYYFLFYRNGGNFWNLLAKSDFKDFDSDTNLEVGWIVSKTVRCVDISSNPSG